MLRIITLCAVGIKFHRICAADEHFKILQTIYSSEILPGEI